MDPRLGYRSQSTVKPPTPPPPPGPPPPRAVDGNNVNGSQSIPAQTNGQAQDNFRLSFCTVCASNNNRSMEAHLRLAKANYPVVSFGTGTYVRLPGATQDNPNVYDFDTTTYRYMEQDLKSKNERLYRHNGCLKILERNQNVKATPERFQNWRVGEPRYSHHTDLGSKGTEGGIADIIISCEERCWEIIVEDLLNRGSPLSRPVHVINMDIKDSNEEALNAGEAILDLANRLNNAAIQSRTLAGPQGWSDGSGRSRTEFDARVPTIVSEWQETWPKYPALWTLAWL